MTLDFYQLILSGNATLKIWMYNEMIICFLCPKALNDAIHILSRNRTCLIITRRRQTIEAADQIVLIYRGNVIEQGTLDELRQQGRLYHLLTNLQA